MTGINQWNSLKLGFKSFAIKYIPSPILKAWQWRPKNRVALYGYKVLRFLVTLLLVFLGFNIIFPLKTKIEYAPVVKAKDGTILYAFLTQDQQWRMFTSIDEITPELSKAIVFKEDKYFYKHPGINPIAVGRALFNNLFQQKRTSGASTITMQVARLLEPKNRSYGNKLIEMFRALQLEWRYSKKEILQLYLNLVPYGSNIQGVKAASLLYFDKSPEQLSLAQITALSIIPNRPNSLVMGRDNTTIMQVRNKWLQRFLQKDLFDKATIQDALSEHLEAQRISAPRNATQFAIRMRNQFPQLLEINTAIDAQIQFKAETLSRNYTNSLKLKDIHNAAVIVLDNKSHKVLAYVGSSNFFDNAHHGQVDGVKAVRSPGSTLKPLLYGLAFDKGIATPKTIISDIPVSFKGYAPENYDLDFRGNVSIEEALRQSLNIPSVKTLNALGVANFVGYMQDAGFDAVWKDRKKMGLSMILGGCGVRLEELAALYASFANQGKYYPIQWLQATETPKSDSTFQLLSPESSYMLHQVLQSLQRPDLRSGSVAAINIPKVAWKTGTSYGRRDAWSIGYNERYTIGVWIGNFNGQGAAELNGAGTATPLLFQLFNAIDRNNITPIAAIPKNLDHRLVCALSGLIPNQFCTEQILDAYIPGGSSNAICQHLKEVAIAADSAFSYCTSCIPANGYITKTYPNIAPDLANFYISRNIPFQSIPPHNPDCGRNFTGEAPHIQSLNSGATYLITDKGKQQLQLSCAAANDVSKVFWYINDQFIGQGSKNEKLLFVPTTSKVKISCTDDKGRTSNIFINIKFV